MTMAGKLGWGTILFVFLYLVQATALLDRMQDDAFISFRYATHLSQGEGLRFNQGSEPVEGYSNFLWVVALAAGMKIGFSPVYLSKFLGILAGVCCVVLAMQAARRWFPQMSMALFLFSGVCCSVSWYAALCSVEGLETMLMALFVLAGVLRLLDEMEEPGKRSLFWIWFLLASLTRPEGPIVMIGVLPVLVMTIATGQMPARRVIRSVAMYLCGYLPYLAWRVFYFHDLLPNTFYAKVPSYVPSYLRGIRYLDAYAFGANVGYGALLIAALLVMLGRGWYEFRRDHHVSRSILLPSVVLWYFLFVILVGGDWMSGFRFVVPVLPLISLTFVLLLSECRHWKQGRPIAYYALAVLMLGVVLHERMIGEWSYRWTESGQSAIGEQASWYTRPHVPGINLQGPHYRTAKWIDTNFFPTSVIALSEAGVIPFLARQRIIDYLGLNDRGIGRQYFRGCPSGEVADTILARRPDGIVMAGYTDRRTAGVRGRLPIDQAFLADPEFGRDYRLLHSVPLVNIPADGPDTGLVPEFLVYGRFASIPDTALGIESSPVIDASRGSRQTRGGWYALEGESPNQFRWTNGNAQFFLPLFSGRRRITIDAFAPEVGAYGPLGLNVHCDLNGIPVLDTVISRDGSFSLILHLPEERPSEGCWRGTIRSDTVFHRTISSRDNRQLGIVIRRIALS